MYMRLILSGSIIAVSGVFVTISSSMPAFSQSFNKEAKSEASKGNYGTQMGKSGMSKGQFAEAKSEKGQPGGAGSQMGKLGWEKPSTNNHSHYSGSYHYGSHYNSYGPSYNSYGYNHYNNYNDYPSSYSGSTYTGSTYTGSSTVACAPAQIDSNVAVTEKVSKALLKDVRFADETVFKSKLSSILEIKDQRAKLDAFFSLVDVKSAEDVAYFVGARDEELDRYEAVLIKNTELSPELADEVVSKLTKALKSSF